MESIISALISALATILAAWISNRGAESIASPPPPRSRSRREGENQERVNFSFAANTIWWIGVMGVFSLLLIYAGFFIHWDLPSMMGLFGIPLIVIVLGIAKPTRPWAASSFVFGVSTIAFTTEFLVKMSWGQSLRLSPGDKWLPIWMFLIASAYAFIAYSVCWWRRR